MKESFGLSTARDLIESIGSEQRIVGRNRRKPAGMQQVTLGDWQGELSAMECDERATGNRMEVRRIKATCWCWPSALFATQISLG